MVSSTDAANSLTVDGASSSRVRAQGDDRRRVDLRSGRAALPGLDLLRLPAPHRRPSRALVTHLGCGFSTHVSFAVRAPRECCSWPMRRSESSWRCSCWRRPCCSRALLRARSTGASLADVTTPLVVLCAVVVARALAAWGFEVAGRRAAGDVISQLRLDLVETRLRSRPAALDGVQSAEVATAAVSGVDALEATFARYLPQVVLAVVVPVAVLVLVASIDLLAAGVMLRDAAARPGLHVARRALHGASRA